MSLGRLGNDILTGVLRSRARITSPISGSTLRYSRVPQLTSHHYQLARTPKYASRQFSTKPKSPRRTQYVKFNSQHPLDINQWDLGMKVLVGVVLGSGVYYVAHLEKVPETGRWRFMDVNPKFETKLAKEAHDELISEFEGRILPPNHPVTRHVRRVVTRILEANNLGTLKSSAPRSQSVQVQQEIWGTDVELGRQEPVAPGAGGREWELMVVNDDKMVNAGASYGNIVVFTGILPVARDEQGLAAILGHEIGHVVARHNSERYSSAKIFLAFASLLAILGLDFGVARLASSLLLDLPNSRNQELEADAIGLRLSSKACYDPKAAPAMFTRMAELEKASGRLNVNFLYTHPTSEVRVKRLEAMLPEAYALQAATPECAPILDHLASFGEAFASGFSGSKWS
ncbi:hypothetical protein QCA50_001085 [Cerrena zonata]|uniref:Peptidase M48 domain-containing protein n=1 Tax=Cerrena zonata TaxID=2478898 RepID=A0AAW0GSP1_9APHY